MQDRYTMLGGDFFAIVDYGGNPAPVRRGGAEPDWLTSFHDDGLVIVDDAAAGGLYGVADTVGGGCHCCRSSTTVN